MFKNKNSQIDIIKSIDVKNTAWCNDAILIKVTNGMGALTYARGNEDKNYVFESQLLLNNKPIVQAKYPICPTCAGLIATGYGIEKIDCPELQEVSEKINQDYVNLETSAEILQPLLALLDDGYYLLADVPHYPTGADGKFFHNVPNELTENKITCTSYYKYKFYTAVDSFPAYLYPTQTASCYKHERVDYYMKKLSNNQSAPRAIAYYHAGFSSFLLDGHHKAYAAAKLCQTVNCLTIMPISSYRFLSPCDRQNPIVSVAAFGTIRIENENNMFTFNLEKIRKEREKYKIEFEQFNLVDTDLSDMDDVVKCMYPTLEHVTDLYALDIENIEFTDEIIAEWLDNPDDETSCKLECALRHFHRYDKQKARKLALKIVCDNAENTPRKTAYQVLTQFDDNEVEQVFVAYLVDHDNRSEFYDIVCSYWK